MIIILLKVIMADMSKTVTRRKHVASIMKLFERATVFVPVYLYLYFSLYLFLNYDEDHILLLDKGAF